MDWFSQRFIKAGLGWLGLGVLFGLAMTVYPSWVVFRPVHAHLNLLGFVAMIISGVAYHVIPRFTGHPLHSLRLAGAHWWLANIGLVVLTGGFFLSLRYGPRFAPVTITGGTLSALAAWAFIYNMWRTIDGRHQAPPPATPARRLSVIDQ
jgi:cbb3-type cytochrome oxidase subunit 1